MSVELHRDPRFKPFQQVKRKFTPDIELKRVKWDHDTLIASFKAIEESFAKKFKANDFEARDSVCLQSQQRESSAKPAYPCRQVKTSRNSTESAVCVHCNSINENLVVTSHVKPSILFEISWKNKIKRFSSETEEKKEERRENRKKILMAESTHLEHYLMRIHEWVQMSSDENYVEGECEKLLSTVIKRVATESEDEFCGRRV